MVDGSLLGGSTLGGSTLGGSTTWWMDLHFFGSTLGTRTSIIDTCGSTLGGFSSEIGALPESSSVRLLLPVAQSE
jgi:hypothetical protein